MLKCTSNSVKMVVNVLLTVKNTLLMIFIQVLDVPRAVDSLLGT